MADEVYDVVVIGAGIVGSSTAYNLVKSSYKTLLLEQFGLPHTRGSSHGQSRITRKAYSQDYYAAMMPEAYDLWATLEKESGTNLYTKTGLLVIGGPNCPEISSTEKALRKLGSAYEPLTTEQMRKRFPQLNIPQDYCGLVEPDGGVLKSHKALIAYQTIFQRNGGTLVDEAKVEKIIPGNIVTVQTNQGEFRGKSIVIAAGPWTSKIVRPLGFHIPLQPVRISVNYWKEKNPGEHNSKRFPCFIKMADQHSARHIYGLPAEEYPNCVKICLHVGPEINPDERDIDKSAKWDVDLVREFIRKFFPGLHDEPCIMESCLYTMTPDEDYVIDAHPHWKNIVVGAGFSGHGFKLAPITGKLLAELATGRKTSYDTKPFRVERFSKVSNTSKL